METIWDLPRNLYNLRHKHNFVRRASIAPLANGHQPEYHFAACDGIACRALQPWPKEVFQRECLEHVAEMKAYLHTHDYELVVAE
ncbi:MAG: hypothetical protein O2794_02545 [bacterium]|nr:hypothetical protein [bacterium]